MGSVWLAIIYIGGWILSMRIFGHFWRRRKLAINDAEPWFPKNEALEQYISLLQQVEPEATEAQLQAALMRRAIEGVQRVLSMREDKPVLAHLVKQGTVGDDIWTEFSVSEKELEQEIIAIVEEANTYKEGWGQTILQTASELVMHEMSKKQGHSHEDEEHQHENDGERKEQSRKQKEKNKETNKEGDRARILQELLAEEEAESAKAAKAAKAANAAKKKKAASPKSKKK